MQKAGEYLKSIRDEKGFSILEVSKSTKLSASVLRALEEGRIDNIDPIYLKGFLKIYCRFLGIGWEDFLKDYPLPSQNKHPHKQPEKPREEKRAAEKETIIKNKKLILIFVSAVAASLFIILAFRGCVSIFKKLSTAAATARKAAAAAPKTPAKTVTKKPKPATQAMASSKSAPSKPVAVSPAATSKESAERSPIPATAAKDVKSKEVTLVVRAQEDCHLTVRIDGKLVYQRQLPKTKTESWTAKDKIEFSVGNAGGIVIEANGKIISTLGRRAQAIKNILITREGLKIP